MPEEIKAQQAFERALSIRAGRALSFYYYWDGPDYCLARQNLYLYTQNQEWTLDAPAVSHLPISGWSAVSGQLASTPTKFDLAGSISQRRLARYARVVGETRLGMEPLSGIDARLQTTEFASWSDWLGTLGASARQLKTVMFSRVVETSDQAQEANDAMKNLARRYGLSPTTSVKYGQKSLEWLFPEVYQQIQDSIGKGRTIALNPSAVGGRSGPSEVDALAG